MKQYKCKKQFNIFSSEGDFTVEIGEKIIKNGFINYDTGSFVKCQWKKIIFYITSGSFDQLVEVK